VSTIWLLIGVNAGLYAAMWLASPSKGNAFTTGELIGAGALYPPLVRRRGEIWRLYTCTFLHVRPEHALMNLYALYQVGHTLAPAYGAGRLVLVYVAGGLGGSLASFVWRVGAPIKQTTTRFSFRRMTVSAGASGAICAMIGAAAVIAEQLGSSSVRNAMLQWGAIVLLFGLAPFVDNMAHLGGMATGAAIAFLLGRPALPAHADPYTALWWALFLAPLAASLVLAWRVRGPAAAALNLVNDGVARATAGDTDGAVRSYRAAIALHEKHALAHYDLAISLRRTQDLAAARVEARRAVEIDPDWAQAKLLVKELG
jgi:rhomboid protease GluP